MRPQLRKTSVCISWAILIFEEVGKIQFCNLLRELEKVGVCISKFLL
ncbi:hypothetical protein SOVF_119250 [Spinacia oleracea]|nr:hypothetical protein SOVF_119250 [Spinacia oleracea]